ncbi:nucleotidyltransferase family protein [Belliella sp. R4-6]|uniref:Nucleotidyltransferase family protein n=1 Tax=Belliella alkalica TaxID=1730871 RepID=A0ABS9VC87_9BACT|nr:nucleotidyltransferase family protein [Belliella alkalica]MCH7414062.1 nucleotidyltransferase family protein [Belliella alkalica]
MFTKNEILSKLSELKPFLYEEFSVKEIGLFGSYNDDSFDEESDIDILVELEKPIGWKFLKLEMFLQKIFNKRIDLTTKNALKEQLKVEIMKKIRFVQ